jgi:phosphatidylinositol alpha 1,6-mannosyltransferase
MEIAFFSESYVPIRDGVAQQVHALARRFQRMGHGVRVYTPSSTPGEPKTHSEVDGVPVVRVRSLPIPFYREYRWGLFPMKDLRGEGFRDEVDVIHLHTPGILGSTGFLAARYFRRDLPYERVGDAFELPAEPSDPDVLPGRAVVRARALLPL